MFQYILKSVVTFLIRNYFYSNAKKNNSKTKTNETRTNFDQTTDSLIENHQTIYITFKTHISELIAKIGLKERSLNQVRHCLTVHLQI